MVTSKRYLKKIKIREHLLDVAETLLSQKSLNKFYIADLVSLAEVSKKTFYAYFDTKEDLLLGLASRAYENITVLMKNTINEQFLAIEQIKQFLRINIGYFRKHPVFWKVLHFFDTNKIPIGHFYFSQMKMEYPTMSSKSARKYLQYYEQYLQIWLKYGIFRCLNYQTRTYFDEIDTSLRNDLDPIRFALSLETILGGIMNQLLERDLKRFQIDPEHLLKYMIPIILEGIEKKTDHLYTSSEFQKKFVQNLQAPKELSYPFYSKHLLTNSFLNHTSVKKKEMNQLDTNKRDEGIINYSEQQDTWERTRFEILHLAQLHIQSEGVNNFSIKFFAESQNIPKSTIYGYFSSKDDLIFALAGWWFFELTQYCKKYQNKNFVDTFRQLDLLITIFWQYFQFAQENLGFLEIVNHAHKLPLSENLKDLPLIIGEYNEHRNELEYFINWEEYLGIIQAIIKYGHNDNSIRQDIPIPFFSFMLSSFFHGVILEANRHLTQYKDANASKMDIFEDILQILIVGIGISK